MPRLATQIEAILYLKGKPLSIADIAELAGCDREDAEDALIELMADYSRRDSALEVVETPAGYSLQLRSSFQDIMQSLVPAELGVGALRTLAAIALKTPIAQTDLIELRGSGAYQHVQELIELMADYARRDSALEVVETPAGYSLQLRSSFQDIMQSLVPAELGVGALRTLAAIALKTPIAQTDLIELRGSGAYQHVQELIELGFVQKRKQSDGRSYWLQVTEKFHQHFELDRLLPPLEPNSKS